MKYLLVFLFSFSTAQAAIDLTKVFINPERDSYLLNVLLDHLKTNVTDEQTKEKLLRQFETINNNFQYTSKKNYQLVLSTELTKSLLNFRASDEDVDVSGNTIQACIEKLNRKKSEYTELVHFTMQRIIEDYKPFVKNKLLSNYKNQKYRTSNNTKSINKIKLMNKYLGPKVLGFVARTPKQFNKYIETMALEAMEKLQYATFAFGSHSLNKDQSLSIFTGLNEAIIPEKNASSQKAEKTPAEEVKNIKPVDEKSSKIDELIEDVSPQ